jgi:hypothetical protein
MLALPPKKLDPNAVNILIKRPKNNIDITIDNDKNNEDKKEFAT